MPPGLIPPPHPVLDIGLIFTANHSLLRPPTNPLPGKKTEVFPAGWGWHSTVSRMPPHPATASQRPTNRPTLADIVVTRENCRASRARRCWCFNSHIQPQQPTPVVLGWVQRVNVCHARKPASVPRNSPPPPPFFSRDACFCCSFFPFRKGLFLLLFSFCPTPRVSCVSRPRVVSHYHTGSRPSPLAMWIMCAFQHLQ